MNQNGAHHKVCTDLNVVTVTLVSMSTVLLSPVLLSVVLLSPVMLGVVLLSVFLLHVLKNVTALPEFTNHRFSIISLFFLSSLLCPFPFLYLAPKF